MTTLLSVSQGEGDKDKLLQARSAIAAAKDASSITTAKQQGKVSVKETRRFGGQAVQVGSWSLLQVETSPVVNYST